MSDTLKSELLSTPKGTSPGREPPPGEDLEREGSERAEPRPASRREVDTSPGALPARTSPGRRYPDPGFKDIPKFSYPESYRDYVYRDLSKNVKETFLLLTIREYDVVGVGSL